jgi:N-acetylmuramoyl-L-alanine amidase
MSPTIIERPSPNFDDRPPGAPIDMIVLHYTGMKSAEAALRRLCDPEARVSAHYTVDEDGTIYRHVDEAKRAWHAGVSFWAGGANVNGRSIGIELVNPGHEFGYLPFPDAQIGALIELGVDLRRRHPIPRALVLGHSDVAPERKQDPGELFPWKRLAQRDLGLYLDKLDTINYSRSPAIGELQQSLSRIGYDCPISNRLDEKSKYIVLAFQRHFRPARCDGVPDAETVALAAALARRFDAKPDEP